MSEKLPHIVGCIVVCAILVATFWAAGEHGNAIWTVAFASFAIAFIASYRGKRGK